MSSYSDFQFESRSPGFSFDSLISHVTYSLPSIPVLGDTSDSGFIPQWTHGSFRIKTPDTTTNNKICEHGFGFVLFF